MPHERINWNISLSATHSKSKYANIGNAFSALNESGKILTIITSAADSSVKMSTILIKILLFFVFSGVAGFAFFKFYDWWSRRTRLLHRHAIVAFVFCLLMAYCAEEFFGVADITGAYIAGVIISMTQTTQYLSLSLIHISAAAHPPGTEGGERAGCKGHRNQPGRQPSQGTEAQRRKEDLPQRPVPLRFGQKI